MEIIFVPLDGIYLHRTLFNSETSRGILLFYKPEDLGFAVRVRTASLGAALSLVSELRWYVRRYMREVLFRINEGVYATHALAEEIYTRESDTGAINDKRHLFVFRRDTPLEVIPLGVGRGGVDNADMLEGADLAVEVWGPLKWEKMGEVNGRGKDDETQNCYERVRSAENHQK